MLCGPDLILSDLIMEQLVLLAAEVLCYSGALLSAVIVLRLVTMENLSWLNKMFLLYFSLDCIFGIPETYLFFKLHRDRCLVSRSNNASCGYNQTVIYIQRCARQRCPDPQLRQHHLRLETLVLQQAALPVSTCVLQVLYLSAKQTCRS